MVGRSRVRLRKILATKVLFSLYLRRKPSLYSTVILFLIAQGLRMPKKSTPSFPRSISLPKQSPKYWGKEKDRFLRQQLILDIQEQTKRNLVVYFTAHDKGGIEATDADDLSEVLQDCIGKDIDLFIQTPGGLVDACEKLISILGQTCRSYRVVVPSYSKSAGTVIALSSTEIVMGINSELGPIDPQINGVPAEILANNHPDPVARAVCQNDVARMKVLANRVLSKTMFAGKTKATVDQVVDKLSSAQSYLSHGAVIDANDAITIGLNVNFLPSDNELWKRLWLLYCMYDYDCRKNNIGKLFEGEKYSISRLSA